MPLISKRTPIAGGFVATATAVAVALLLTGAVGGDGRGGPSVAVAGCGGKLRATFEAKSRFPKPFAAQYERKLRVRVERGERLRRWRVELYTFSGFRVGKSKRDKRLKRRETAKVKLKLPLQPGRYTVVVKGKVPGCGEKERAEVMRFRSCLGKLPVRLVDKPKGAAADYNSGGFVSVRVEPRPGWAPIRKLRSTLSDFDGVVYGRAELPRGTKLLIGQAFLHNELVRNLEPGKYSLFIEGRAPQPRSCGEKTKTKTLTFG